MGPADSSRDGSIHRILRISRQAIRLMDLSAALLVLLSFALAGLLGMVAADGLVDGGLPAGWRLVLRTIWLIGVVALAGWLVGWPLGRRISDLYAARSLEKSNPALGNDLTAAVELAGRDDLDESTRRVLYNHAAAAARSASPAPVESATLKRASIVLGAVVALCLVYLVITPRPLGASLGRVLLGSEARPALPSDLTLRSPAENQAVIVAQPVGFLVETDKLAPAPRLEIFDHPTGPPRNLPMTAGPLPGQFSARWKPALASAEVQWRVVRNAEHTPRRTLRVLPRPAIRSVRAEVAWPGYTGQGRQPSPTGAIRAPAGAFVTVFAEANLPVARATLSFETGNRRIIMPLDGDATHLRTAFRIHRSDRYRIRFTARGLDEPGESVWYEIITLDDHPPELSLAQPTDDLDWPINKPLALAGQARDEFGLASIRCMIRSGETTRTIALAQFPSPGQTASPFAHTLDLSRLGQVGDLLTVQVEARDHKPGPPSEPVGQVGTSRAFTVRINPPDPTIEAQTLAEQQARQRSLSTPATQPESQPQQTQPADSVAETFQADPADAETLRALRHAVESTQPASKPAPQPQPGQDSPQPDQPASQPDQSAEAQPQGPIEPREPASPPSSQPASVPSSQPASIQPQPPSQSDSTGEQQPSSQPTQPKDQPAQPGQQSQPSQTQQNDSQGESPSQPGGQTDGEQQQADGDARNDSTPTDQPAQPTQAEQLSDQSQPGDSQTTQGEQGQNSQGSGETPSQGQPGRQGESEWAGGQGESSRQGGSPGRAGQPQSSGPGAGESSDATGSEDRRELLAIAGALDEVARQIEADQLDPRLLEQLGMTGPELRAFVKKYAPRARQLSPAPAKAADDARRVETIVETGQASAQPGQGSVSAKRADAPGTTRDAQARQQHDARVAPKHQPRLEGYLRAVSQDKP